MAEKIDCIYHAKDDTCGIMVGCGWNSQYCSCAVLYGKNERCHERISRAGLKEAKNGMELMTAVHKKSYGIV